MTICSMVFLARQRQRALPADLASARVRTQTNKAAARAVRARQDRTPGRPERAKRLP